MNSLQRSKEIATSRMISKAFESAVEAILFSLIAWLAYDYFSKFDAVSPDVIAEQSTCVKQRAVKVLLQDEVVQIGRLERFQEECAAGIEPAERKEIVARQLDAAQ